jgi:hypothetical protein
MARQRGSEEWARLIREHGASGLSLDSFGKKKGVSPGRLSIWKKRLSAGFSEVRVGGERRYEIELRSGIRVRIEGTFEAGEVKRLVEALC